jgi:hypothetical protein
MSVVLTKDPILVMLQRKFAEKVNTCFSIEVLYPSFSGRRRPATSWWTRSFVASSSSTRTTASPEAPTFTSIPPRRQRTQSRLKPCPRLQRLIPLPLVRNQLTRNRKIAIFKRERGREGERERKEGGTEVERREEGRERDVPPNQKVKKSYK